MKFSNINLSVPEGALLIAAIAHIMELRPTWSPDQVIYHLRETSDQEPVLGPVMDYNPMPDFISALQELINKHSRENVSNTPDFILAQYIVSCLQSFEKATQAREKWYGQSLKII